MIHVDKYNLDEKFYISKKKNKKKNGKGIRVEEFHLWYKKEYIEKS